MRYKAVIFDFDGTICDTGEGIINCVKYALSAYGYELPENDEELNVFIGPPLLVSFQEHYGCDVQMAEKLVEKYRERYSPIGVYESRLYPTVEELLIALKQDGFKVGVASSKPQNFIEILLEKFNIKKYFDVICGVTYKTDCESKASIIGRCAKELGVTVKEAFMVGDTHFDIEGAKINLMDGVGALWGFGSRREFKTAGAKFIAEKPMDIEAIALGYFEQTEKVTEIFNGRIIHVHEDDITMVDGQTAKREVVDHNGGVAIVGITENDEVLLVRQFRAPYKEVTFEIPAGKLEKGEDPFEAGKREFQEECGATAQKYYSLGELYPSPGYCGEIIHIYAATGLDFGEQNLDYDEVLDVYKVPLETAFQNVLDGKYKDAKTMVGIMKVREMKRNGSIS